MKFHGSVFFDSKELDEYVEAQKAEFEAIVQPNIERQAAAAELEAAE